MRPAAPNELEETIEEVPWLRLGDFVCEAGVLVVTDPCYPLRDVNVDSGLAVWVPAERGVWDAWLERIDDPELPGPPQIRGLVVVHAGVTDVHGLVWQEVVASLCFDSAQVGVFDPDFYREGLGAVRGELDAAILGPIGAGVVRGGASSSYCHDPRRVAVAIATVAGVVAGVRTTWFSGQLRPRRWQYAIEGVAVELRLEDDVLSALLPGDRWVEHGIGLMFYDDADEVRAALEVPAAVWAEVMALLRRRGFVRGAGEVKSHDA